MPLDKSIIKASTAAAATFEYKPREIKMDLSDVAKDYVAVDAFKSAAFKISDLVARQTGISQLENDALQDKINNQVLERFKEVEEKAYREGYELGQIEGAERAFQETKADFVARLRSIETLLKSIENLKSELTIDNEAALIDLVYQIARKLALRDLEQNRDAVWEILKNVIHEMQADERLTVRLSSEDMLFMESLQEKSAQRIEALDRVKFVADDEIKPGGCRIETEYGTVNATVEERMERMWQALQARMPQKRPKDE